MGLFLNSISAFGLFRRDCANAYFVDKTRILNELIPLLEPSGADGDMGDVAPFGAGEQKYVAITRPRRFGKTVMANMIAAFFGKGVDSRRLFARLHAADYAWFETHINRHNVIRISFNETPASCSSYRQYIGRIHGLLLQDLMAAYPQASISSEDAVWDALTKLYETCRGEKFIFVLDEWDYLYHQDYATEADKRDYTRFLSNLLKDKAYVEMAYMTGILPIAKYSSGSELNMFCEYSMAGEERFSDYFGFLDHEVDTLYQRYLELHPERRNVTREGLRLWYDGYVTKAGRRLYNPRSVVLALENNNLGNYWTSSGPYDELFFYLRENVADVQDDLGKLLADIPVPTAIHEYAATSMLLRTKQEIFSAMVVYGFLNYQDGCVAIPNRELLLQFEQMIQRERSLGNVCELLRASERMLQATKEGDTKTMADILQHIHHTESPLLAYSHEEELASVVKIAYLKARDTYHIEREEKAGTGYADFILYPIQRHDDAIILELKVNDTPENAIRQIRERHHALRLEGRLGERREYTGRILAVGISYRKDDPSKTHHCAVEVLRERLRGD